MDDLVDNLKKLAQQYSIELSKIRDKINSIEDVPKAQALVGKCFKYPNSFGCNSKWWIYIRVLSAEDTEVTTDEFEENSNGQIEFNYNCERYYNTYCGNSSYIPISKEEYLKAREALVKKVIKQNKRKV
jgi:hypothetical protein